MQIRRILIAVLGTVPLAGCPSWFGDETDNCNPPREDFTLDEPVSAEMLDSMLDRREDRTSWEQIPCDEVCTEAYRRKRRWDTRNSKSCSLTLPERTDTGERPGRVTCSGVGLMFYCEGRRPLGHVEAGDADAHDPLARRLAAMAYLEAASVLAFEQLAAQLLCFDAPDELIGRCHAAADDERAHARWLTRLATQRGAEVPSPTCEPASAELFDIALHNAIEGCVHETFAALLAAVRGRSAPSSLLRDLFGRIAVDEARHAQLAWDVHAWLCTRLDADARARIEAAQARALTQLSTRAWVLDACPDEIGSPSAFDAARLADALAARLAA